MIKTGRATLIGKRRSCSSNIRLDRHDVPFLGKLDVLAVTVGSVRRGLRVILRERSRRVFLGIKLDQPLAKRRLNRRKLDAFDLVASVSLFCS